MKKLFRITALATIISLLITLNGGLDLTALSPTARAISGDLTVDWGVLPSGSPIFVVSNMAPGSTETRTVGVTNTTTSPRSVGVKGNKTSETGDLSTQLDITITEGVNTLYGPKTLNEFFADSGGPDGIPLSTLNSGSVTAYTFTVTFKESAGNDFQNTQVIFDLIIGIFIDLPAECDLLDLSSTPIIGSARSETLRGTSANELIMGLEGADKIDGGGGDDCILGGTGADKIDGGGGNDVIFGQEGADTVKGGTGNDILVGEEGADIMEGGSGDDHLIGGIGADRLDGGSENDLLEGDGGADTLKGGSGDDILLGGAAFDSANGGSGIDSCSAEAKTQCEP